METLMCNKCKKVKAIQDFREDKLRNGYKQCRACLRDQKREYRKLPHVKARHNAYNRKYNREYRKLGRVNKKKRRAHRAVKRHLPPAAENKCTRCGGDATEYHHHNGYKKEHMLDVVPVCKVCHPILEGVTIPDTELKAHAQQQKRMF